MNYFLLYNEICVVKCLLKHKIILDRDIKNNSSKFLSNHQKSSFYNKSKPRVFHLEMPICVLNRILSIYLINLFFHVKKWNLFMLNAFISIMDKCLHLFNTNQTKFMKYIIIIKSIFLF